MSSCSYIFSSEPNVARGGEEGGRPSKSLAASFGSVIIEGTICVDLAATSSMRFRINRTVDG